MKKWRLALKLEQSVLFLDLPQVQAHKDHDYEQVCCTDGDYYFSR